MIDAMPETTKARELQMAMTKGTVWLSYYTGQTSVGTKHKDSVSIDETKGVINADRTRTLDETFALFVEGINTLPAHILNVRDYFSHLKASVRVLDKSKNGEMVAHYVESSADHYAHAENYCNAARYVHTKVPRGSQGVYL